MRNSHTKELFDNSLMYLQLAEVCSNADILSKQPWKFRKFHKLTGAMDDKYSFGISGVDRTVAYGNDHARLPLTQVTEIEIIEYIYDYHKE